MSVRLFVLGLVQSRDIHGYDIKEVAKLWGLERWANIGFGSIYHALGKLQEEKLIEERGVEQEGSRPPRYMYRITSEGKTAFFELLRETCRSAKPETRDIDLALAFIHYLPPQERVALLRERQEMLRPRLESLRHSVEGYEQAQSSEDPRHDSERDLLRTVPWVYAGVRHSWGRVQFEWDWMESVIAEVERWPGTP